MQYQPFVNIFLAKPPQALVYHLRFAGHLVDESHSLFRKAYVLPIFKLSVLLAAPNYGAWEGFLSILKNETEKEKRV
jgi:hypothetical protein